MQQFQLWTIDTSYKKICLPDPKLASWNAKSDPEKIAVEKYCDDIEEQFISLLPRTSGLSLHMEIDVKEQKHLLYNHDLDNYLYPVVKRIGARRFTFVSAIKRVGGGSYLQIGSTKSANAGLEEKDGWIPFPYDAIKGISVAKPEWKFNIRNALKDALKDKRVYSLRPGGGELQLVWKCSSQRNWISLWKPTIDAMGPVLGEPDPHRPFHPNDDRIISLALHLNVDNSIGWRVPIGMMWRPSPI